MATAQLGTLMRHIKGLAADPARQQTDRQLLDDFASRGDESAFADLVGRHGAMVLRVCRRVLQHEQDAEDAFQATFLVLARNTASIRRREALGSWLYGVAYRTAMKAKRSAARRRNHEARLRQRKPPAATGPTWDEVQVVLDEEVQRLPESYRAAFVLCVLEGKTEPAAAADLGVKKGTLSWRLARARQRLRKQLARQGIELSTVLAALSLTRDAGKAAVPAALATATIRFGHSLAAGESAAAIPAPIAALAAGVTRATILSKAQIATALLLAAALLVPGTGALMHHPSASGEPPPGGQKSEAGSPKKGPATAKPSAAEKLPEAVEVQGRVVDPDGKPLGRAALFLWTPGAREASRRPRGRTSADGRFRITVPGAELRGPAVLLATADGYGVDWAEMPPSIGKVSAVALRLTRDDVPVLGRLLDLQGRGIAGVEVRVRRIEKRADDGDLAEFVAIKQQWARGKHVLGRATKSLGAEALPAATSAITDAEGRFRLTGLGRDRVVHLLVRGKTIASAYLEVVLRPGSLPTLRHTFNENDATCGATFEWVTAPSKPITGTVREKGTGKPIAGIAVACGRGTARSDDRGRFRIDGIRKQDFYEVTAQGPPYFSASKPRVADTPAFEPLEVDFDLERGLAIRGRVFDRATGKPVEGIVTYHAFADNKHLKKVSGLDEGGQSVGPDGSFTLTGLPGPGLLEFLTDQDDYRKTALAADWDMVPPIRSYPRVAHALVRIDPSEKDPGPAAYEIALEPAKAVQVTVVGPDDKPLSGYYAAGLTASPRNNVSWMFPHGSALLTVRGLDGQRPRTVVLFSPEKKLGKALVVHADKAGPLRERLEPLSSLTGRVLDAAGSPLPGLHVRAVLGRRGEDLDRLPVQFFIAGGTWAAKLEPAAGTDVEGRFRLDGLLPGLGYTLEVSEDDSADPNRLVFRREGVAPAEPGRTRNLGDLRGPKSPRFP
jgi:RNA polymerase sigma factor (sigma-70 family)